MSRAAAEVEKGQGQEEEELVLRGHLGDSPVTSAASQVTVDERQTRKQEWDEMGMFAPS